MVEMSQIIFNGVLGVDIGIISISIIYLILGKISNKKQKERKQIIRHLQREQRKKDFMIRVKCYGLEIGE